MLFSIRIFLYSTVWLYIHPPNWFKFFKFTVSQQQRVLNVLFSRGPGFLTGGGGGRRGTKLELRRRERLVLYNSFNTLYGHQSQYAYFQNHNECCFLPPNDYVTNVRVLLILVRHVTGMVRIT